MFQANDTVSQIPVARSMATKAREVGATNLAFQAIHYPILSMQSCNDTTQLQPIGNPQPYTNSNIQHMHRIKHAITHDSYILATHMQITSIQPNLVFEVAKATTFIKSKSTY